MTSDPPTEPSEAGLWKIPMVKGFKIFLMCGDVAPVSSSTSTS